LRSIWGKLSITPKSKRSIGVYFDEASERFIFDIKDTEAILFHQFWHQNGQLDAYARKKAPI
jgi:hypothetical protein